VLTRAGAARASFSPRSFDEWTDPADQALSGGRGMLVPTHAPALCGFPHDFVLFPNLVASTQQKHMYCLVRFRFCAVTMVRSLVNAAASSVIFVLTT
jgi:hypothetical protein